MSDVTRASEAYQRLRAAEERHWALLQMTLCDETYSPSKLMASAEEVRACHAEFMAFGDALLPTGAARAAD